MAKTLAEQVKLMLDLEIPPHQIDDWIEAVVRERDRPEREEAS